MDNNNPEKNENGLERYLSPAGVWAISIGTAMGWGSFVITGNTYLSSAGPAGSVLGLIIGAVVMLFIARNYHYMMDIFPDAGGAYTYTRKLFGFDYGFLTAWFLALTYIAILWANVTSLPIFASYFFGDLFRFGSHYHILQYDVYPGEILLCMAALIITGLFVSGTRRLKCILMVILSSLFTLGIVVCFVVSFSRTPGGIAVFNPAFVPEKSAMYQVIKIACISPWAFIGFENISNSTEELNFPGRKIFPIFTVVIISTTILYIFVILLSITTYPPEYRSYLSYIRDIGNLSGLKALPAFYAANRYMGMTGVVILMITLLSLVITSLIGNTLALSRLIYALAKDQVLPPRFLKLNKAKNPVNAIALIIIISLFIPFFGRTAVGWIVDVTTLGATMIYGFVSGAAFSKAFMEGKKTEMITGAIGSVVMIFFMILLALPNFLSSGAMATESYILFAVWAIIGLIVFRQILKHDQKNRRFGKSGIVWVVLLVLVLMTSLEWVKQLSAKATEQSMNDIIDYYNLDATTEESDEYTDDFIREEMARLARVNNYSTGVTVVLFAFAIWIILSNQSIMVKRELEHEKELGEAKTVAYTDPLTGVKSKAAYVEKEAMFNSEIKDGNMQDFAIVVCDINGLKQVNDTMGHKAGDELIRNACKMICVLFKHSPVFRIGGDEFVAVLVGTDYENRKDIMKELNLQVERNKKDTRVVIAAGISEYVREQDKSFHEVFERADALMYIRKKELKS